jgi:hypothetical protein
MYKIRQSLRATSKQLVKQAFQGNKNDSVDEAVNRE